MSSDALRSAKVLQRGGHVRSCLNRAYYSAYAAATGALIDCGVDVRSADRPNPGHQQLVELVRHNLRGWRFGRGVRLNLSRRLRSLRRLREAADYDPESELNLQEARIALQHASAIQKRIAG